MQNETEHNDQSVSYVITTIHITDVCCDKGHITSVFILRKKRDSAVLYGRDLRKPPMRSLGIINICKCLFRCQVQYTVKHGLNAKGSEGENI